MSQSSNHTAVETRVPGARYAASGLKKFFLGEHYRELWTTPITVPILDLDSFAGGLVPIRAGGGLETKTLRLQNAKGAQYTFRSLDKDPRRILPPNLRETIAAGVVQDQISSAHPYAAPVVASLAEAVGVLHAKPKLVIMPDDARLGVFRADFAGMLGFIEERPDEGPEGEPGFADSYKILGTDKLFDELEKDCENVVDAKTYLKARLLDILVGDWDRDADQWRWARFPEEGKKVWYPIPRDRDHAFSMFDGVLPRIADLRFVVPQFEGFNKKTPDLVSLTYSGRHLDRRFLATLSREEFLRIGSEFVDAVTEQAIENAVRQLPESIYALCGEELVSRLHLRRAFMEKSAFLFYHQLARYVDLETSNRDEYVEVVRSDDDHVQVRAYVRNSDTGEKDENYLLFQRTFVRGVTREIRIYLLGGNDKVVVSGTVERSIVVRIIGGSGEDEIVDQSKVTGVLFGLIPFIPKAESKTYLYDVAEGTHFITGPSSVRKTSGLDIIANHHTHQPLLPDYGTLTVPVPYFSLNPDDGLFFGLGLTRFYYGFRKWPYAFRSSLRGNFAFKTGTYQLHYTGDHVLNAGSLRLQMEADAWVPREVRNFYGFGNDSRRDATLEKNDFYRVRSVEYMFKPSLRFALPSRAYLFWGAAFKHFDTEFDEKITFTSLTRPYGVEIPSLLELGAGFMIDRRDRAVAAIGGYYLNAGISHFPKVLNNENAFVKGSVDGRVYFTPAPPVTLAFQAVGQKAWGTFPFYEAVALGGGESLRGFRRFRFAGDAALSGRAEVRVYLLRRKMIVPASYGVFFFSDAGRVWWQNESPGGWHQGFGGGLWLAPLGRRATFSISIASATEGIRINAGSGFAF